MKVEWKHFSVLLAAVSTILGATKTGLPPEGAALFCAIAMVAWLVSYHNH